MLWLWLWLWLWLLLTATTPLTVVLTAAIVHLMQQSEPYEDVYEVMVEDEMTSHVVCRECYVMLRVLAVTAMH